MHAAILNFEIKETGFANNAKSQTVGESCQLHFVRFIKNKKQQNKTNCIMKKHQFDGVSYQGLHCEVSFRIKKSHPNLGHL